MNLILVKDGNGYLTGEVTQREGFKRLERVCGSGYVALGVYCEAIHQTMLAKMLNRTSIPLHAFC